MLSRRFLLSLTVALAALAFTGQALAAGGRYAVDGGTTFERAQVRSALAASSFPWSVVHVRVRIHVRPGAVTRSVPGEIWVDAKLLDAGPYSWAYVQHEYAPPGRFLLAPRLGSRAAEQNAWWQPVVVGGAQPRARRPRVRALRLDAGLGLLALEAECASAAKARRRVRCDGAPAFPRATDDASRRPPRGRLQALSYSKSGIPLCGGGDPETALRRRHSTHETRPRPTGASAR